MTPPIGNSRSTSSTLLEVRDASPSIVDLTNSKLRDGLRSSLEHTDSSLVNSENGRSSSIGNIGNQLRASVDSELLKPPMVPSDDENFRSILGGEAHAFSSRRPSSIRLTPDYTRTPKFVIGPHSTIRKSADVVLSVLLFYCALVIPFQAAFERDLEDNTSSSLGLFVMDSIVDICFILDMGLNFRTAYFSQVSSLSHRNMNIFDLR
eukprot:TRINITY_DN8135_c0_g1::TRINITY_DN8135_c0_g1_i1::g.7232::m.7232 TRINITY_DN8135_c0_g1::TRINITY_DN8135_c0_g1_i1::g.7232  ORF type:complete len:234 (+),score=-1.69,sp/Q02280/KCNAE_DROME/34.67/5e-08,Ion_trans_N/PF08412.5/0.13 TRINITY_DN8135_c0_g1_i1:83-703(+)